ncbi:hypothetical protein GCM10010136_23830 [Limoniibacter endophyticus]|uniref:Uncharacterized protein n=1 Tax=Limoniibacter endophyticus TaxID=1565040 RepID=A0A8J3DTD2_9HYPH|nr:hypothetical protein [Limoniibacter endophyticus]GHC74546.1 hypothetical protein GCM10010136_23830 [Limoniibacter endophyticus]
MLPSSRIRDEGSGNAASHNIASGHHGSFRQIKQRPLQTANCRPARRGQPLYKRWIDQIEAEVYNAGTKHWPAGYPGTGDLHESTNAWGAGSDKTFSMSLGEDTIIGNKARKSVLSNICINQRIGES